MGVLSGSKTTQTQFRLYFVHAVVYKSSPFTSPTPPSTISPSLFVLQPHAQQSSVFIPAFCQISPSWWPTSEANSPCWLLPPPPSPHPCSHQIIFLKHCVLCDFISTLWLNGWKRQKRFTALVLWISGDANLQVKENKSTINIIKNS